MRILYVVARASRFTDIDRDALRAAGHELVELTGRPRPGAALAAARADAVVVWFAGWHAFIPVTVAWLLRRPSLVITGGYDVAATDDGYGMQHGGLRRFVARWSLRRATRLMANSESGGREARRAAPKATVDVVHHGIPDLVGAMPDGERSGALTVGAIDAPNLVRKGLLPFVEAARELPAVPFALVGKSHDPAAEQRLREAAGPNVELTGFVDDDELARRYARAAVYVQASTHEGFGMAVAEAMLAGCVPVVTPVGALPEVVGDAGVVVEGGDVAGAIRLALSLGEDARRRARARVLERFTLEQRAEGLQRSLAAAAGGGPLTPG